VIFIGTGENLDDLSLFNTDDFVDALFGDQPAVT
jgi:signal recognition particle GTPase